MNVQRKSLLSGAAQAEGLPIVIDVLRAFSNAAVMFWLGLDKLILVGTPEEALVLKAEHGYITAGEVDGVKVTGFDFGNSPSELLQSDAKRLEGRTAVLRTSAGTRGVLAACECNSRVLLGSYVMAKAIAEYVKRQAAYDTVTLVPMGLGGEITSVEDEACADYLEHLLTGTPYDHLQTLWRCMNDPYIQKSLRGERLHLPKEDVLICLQRDLFDFVLLAEKVQNQVVVQKQPVV